MKQRYIFLLKRLLMVPVTLLGICLITFGVLHLAPGGPVDRELQRIRHGSSASGGGARSAHGVPLEVVKAIEKQYGFDKPVYVRFFSWVGNVAQFDLGRSFEFQKPVSSIIAERAPISMLLGFSSFVLTYALGLMTGLYMAARRGRRQEQFVLWPLLASAAVPSFAVASILLLLFAEWGPFPAGYAQSEGYAAMTTLGKILDRAHHLALPLIAHLCGAFTSLALFSRDNLVSEMGKDHIRTARAIGVGERTLLSKHALRNAMLPILSGFGAQLAAFLTGSLFIETIFQLNGLGSLGYQAILARDYNVVMGLVLLQSFGLMVGNLASDLAFTFIDPRVEMEAA